MFNEHDTIILTGAVTADDGTELVPGDVGCIIHIHGKGEAYVAEFMSIDGGTIDIATVTPDNVRSASSTDMSHSRETSPAN